MTRRETLSLAEEARAVGAMPRIHPNGFIQLTLGAGSMPGLRGHSQRLHVWDCELPRQVLSSPIHDHEFALTSFVLVGEIENLIYVARAMDNNPDEGGPSYQVHCVQRVEGSDETQLIGLDEFIELDLAGSETVAAGGSYTHPAGVLHESMHNGRSMTLITKDMSQMRSNARVLVPFNSSPENDFQRGVWDVNELWDLVFETVSMIED